MNFALLKSQVFNLMNLHDKFYRLVQVLQLIQVMFFHIIFMSDIKYVASKQS